jgi:hypothetical protein
MNIHEKSIVEGGFVREFICKVNFSTDIDLAFQIAAKQLGIPEKQEKWTSTGHAFWLYCCIKGRELIVTASRGNGCASNDDEVKESAIKTITKIADRINEVLPIMEIINISQADLREIVGIHNRRLGMIEKNLAAICGYDPGTRDPFEPDKNVYSEIDRLERNIDHLDKMVDAHMLWHEAMNCLRSASIWTKIRGWWDSRHPSERIDYDEEEE